MKHQCYQLITFCLQFDVHFFKQYVKNLSILGHDSLSNSSNVTINPK